jgi:hypothetical protein
MCSVTYVEKLTLQRVIQKTVSSPIRYPNMKRRSHEHNVFITMHVFSDTRRERIPSKSDLCRKRYNLERTPSRLYFVLLLET